MEHYVTDRNINFVGLDRIDELNLIQYPDENDTCKTPTRINECGESRERVQPVSTCCQNSSSYYSHSAFQTRFFQDSAL
ncbi:unnamed protein product [Hymenolepis diminuta]|uniref:Uncharacterized protein n=1 Tax=Hymenolepis diminuta TaxID=6216 RepID=A0A564YVC1_HYMDI|nr:unnamed protein product [Hymenolepis diminuta]